MRYLQYQMKSRWEKIKSLTQSSIWLQFFVWSLPKWNAFSYEEIAMSIILESESYLRHYKKVLIQSMKFYSSSLQGGEEKQIYIILFRALSKFPMWYKRTWQHFGISYPFTLTPSSYCSQNLTLWSYRYSSLRYRITKSKIRSNQMPRAFTHHELHFPY